MRVRLNFISLFLLNIFLLFNFVYIGFALINSISFNIISTFYEDDTQQKLLNGIIIEYHTLIIFTLVIISYSWILTNPLIHIIEWITLLAENKYKEPIDRNGVARSTSKKRGKLKYTYVFFKSIISNLQYLTDILTDNEKERKSLDKMKREWITDIAHDLKTPLSYVKGYSSMLLTSDQWTSEERVKFLLKIEEKADYMESLLRNLNDMFEFDNQSLDIEKEQQDLVGFIREILIEFANDPMTEGYQIQMSHCFNNYFPYAFNPSLIRRSLHNLLTNAVIHNPKGTCVDISIARDDLFVIVRIKDNGKGMSQETIRHIYRRDYNGNTVSKDEMESGLGMSIVKKFVEAHGGNILIKSEVDEGTIVTLYLPV